MTKACFKKPMGEQSPHFVHGGSIRMANGLQESIYSVWVNMRQRCNNKNRPDYKFYGGRGIRCCVRWNKYKNFFKDMGFKYYQHKKKNSSTTLDRINTNGNYSNKNCRWANRWEQSNNRNYNRIINYGGRSMSIGAWAKELPIQITTQNLNKRIVLRGWSTERAFTQPLRKKQIV